MKFPLYYAHWDRKFVSDQGEFRFIGVGLRRFYCIYILTVFVLTRFYFRMTTKPISYQSRTKTEKIEINWNQLTPIVSDNVALKQKLVNISALPFHQLVRRFDQLSPNEITILFQTGILTNKIIHQNPSNTSKRIYFTAYSVQFLQHLLERHLVPHDVMLLVETRDNELVLKPIMYDNIQTLNYLLLKKQANADVADSNGCPSFLDDWKQTNPKQIDIFKLHKLLTLGAKGIGVDTNGDNLLHFIVSGNIPWGPISNVLRYFMRREDLQSLVSQPNKAGLQPLHLLMKQAFAHTSSNEYDFLEIISFLIELGTDVNARIMPSGLTALHIIVINYMVAGWTDTLPDWLLFLSPYLRIIPDGSGITPLVLALHFRRKNMIEFIQNHISLSVRDVHSCQACLIASNSQRFSLYDDTNRIFILLRVKLGIICPFRPIETLMDASCDKLVLALNNVDSCSDLSSPWFLDYMETQMESLLIRTVNESMDNSTLCYFLHCYLESLNSEYTLPTGSVTQKNYLADFNFQLSKHLTRIVRAIGHLRTKCQIAVFMDKFLSFLYKRIFPLLDKKLKPSHINAVKFGYIGHFLQDVVFQITIVLYIWYNQVSEEGKESVIKVINSVWQRIIHSPNSQMSVLGMCVAAITAWRVKICVELKLDCTEILQLFKEIGANFNTRMLPSCLTPITWILTNEQAGKLPAISLLQCVYELGGYLYVRNEEGLTAIDLALKNSALNYRLWGQTFSQVPRPLKTFCAECIVANKISIRSFGRSKHLTEFVNLHKSTNDNELFVFKSGEICVSFQDVFNS